MYPHAPILAFIACITSSLSILSVTNVESFWIYVSVLLCPHSLARRLNNKLNEFPNEEFETSVVTTAHVVETRIELSKEWIESE